MTTPQTAHADFDTVVQHTLQDSTDPSRERLRMLRTVLDAPDSTTHTVLDPEYILIEALLQLSAQAHADLGLHKAEVSLELTTQEALTLAPNLIPATLQALQEDIPEELQDRILEEMNQRAQRALEILPEGDRLSLTQALQRRISSTPTPAHPQPGAPGAQVT